MGNFSYHSKEHFIAFLFLTLSYSNIGSDHVSDSPPVSPISDDSFEHFDW